MTDNENHSQPYICTLYICTLYICTLYTHFNVTLLPVPSNTPPLSSSANV